MFSKFFWLFFIIIIFSSCEKESQILTEEISEPEIKIVDKKPEIDLTKAQIKAKEALEFCKKNNLNTDFAILIDMSLHSGVKRFVVWDFNESEISNQYLVGHGCGTNSWSSDESKENAKFSNEDGSHLSSLGKYKLGERGHSDWGIGVKYLMHGMEKTNNNALKRFIVFHSWEIMSDEEIYPKGSPEGWGCPTISNNAMKKIDGLLQKSEKPLLMWIYN